MKCNKQTDGVGRWLKRLLRKRREMADDIAEYWAEKKPATRGGK